MRRVLALCLIAIATPAAIADEFLQRLRPSPEPIRSYSESLAPAYEGIWPTGEPHPLYAESLDRLAKHPAPRAALLRLRQEAGESAAQPLPRPIRQSDYRDAIVPGLTGLVASMRQAGVSSGAIVLGVSMTVEVPELTRRWVVQGIHSPPVESILRPWLLARAMARTHPRLAVSAAEVTPARFVAWLENCSAPGRSGVQAESARVAVHVASGPSHPAWRELVSAGALPYEDAAELTARSGALVLRGRRVGVVYDERPELLAARVDMAHAVSAGVLAIVPTPGQERLVGWGARALPAAEPSADTSKVELILPPVKSFVGADGQLDKELHESVFRQETPSPYDTWSARATKFRAPNGSLLLDGRIASRGDLARLARAVRAAPGEVLAHEYHRPTRLGDRELFHHFVVLATPGGEPLVTGPGAAQAVGSAGEASWLPAVLTGPGDPAAAPRETAAGQEPTSLARDAAQRLDGSRYERLVRVLAGENPDPPKDPLAVSPATPPITNRANGRLDNQLEEVVQLLSTEYRAMGLEPVPFRFQDGGRSWVDLAVDVQGETTGVVIVADHYDTAIDDATIDGFSRKGWLAAPGADDNASGTAALVESARALAKVFGTGQRPRRTIRLLHLTGEEFPTDCLGARHYAERCLRQGERIDAVLVLDMIGFRDDPGAGIFQLSEGEAVASGALTGHAQAACRFLKAAGHRVPSASVCPRFDPESYLYNTDGVIFSDVGIPTLLFNEHLNKFRGLNRTGYHDQWDTPARMDFRYAVTVARVALMTAVAAAMAE